LTYLCDIFVKLNKLNISMQGLVKNMLDTSDKLAVFVEKLSLWKEGVTNMSECFQCFTFI